MKLTHTVLAAAVASAMALSLAACNNGSQNPADNQSPDAAPMASSTAANGPMMPPPATSTPAGNAMPAMNGSSAMAGSNTASNWFGGPVYTGEPSLAATAALVKAGGGADNFDFSTALVAMLGQDTVNAEVAKLNEQYGKDKVDTFLKGATFVVNDALKRAKEAGIELPPPADLSGQELAKALVKAGTAPDGTFWAGYMLDHTISHKLHNQVMADVDAKFSHAVDGTTHKILNQAMYDVAQKLGMQDVKLASFH